MENKYKIPIIKIGSDLFPREDELIFRNNFTDNNFIQHYFRPVWNGDMKIDYSRFIGKDNETYIMFGIDISIRYK
jgi:hypothetical protein